MVQKINPHPALACKPPLCIFKRCNSWECSVHFFRDPWIKPKADWRDVDSPQKTTNLLCLLFAFHGKQNKFIRLFFVRIYGAPNLLSVLSDLNAELV